MHRPTPLLAGCFAALSLAFFLPRAEAQTPVVVCAPTPAPVTVPNPADCSLVPACGGCEGASLIQTCSRAVEVPPWTGKPIDFQFDAFDPTLGELVKADIIITANAEVTLVAENVDTSGPCNGGFVSVDTAVTVDFDQLPGPPNTVPMPFDIQLPVLATGDGIPDFNGPPGSTANLFVTPVFQEDYCFDSRADLDALTAMMPGDLVSFTATTPGATSSASGCGSIAFFADIKTGLKIEVIYTFCPNVRPALQADDAETCQGVFVDVDVLANDVDPDGQLDCTSIDILSGPANGSAVPVNCAGLSPCVGCRVRYTPSPRFIGVDSFVYRVMDNDGCWSDPEMVTITVLASPIALDDLGFSCQGDPAIIDVLANDHDPDGSIDCGTIVITTQPTGGSVQISPNCTGPEPCANCVLIYTPNGSFSGSDSFGYRVSDADGCQSNEAIVSISVNARPITKPDGVAFCQGTSRVINVLQNDFDPDGTLDCSSLVIISQPTNGTAVISSCTGAPNCNNCRIVYTPAGNFAGPDSFTYQVSDNTGCASAVEVVNVNVRALPIANNDAGITCEDDFVDIDVLANDDDPDNLLNCASILITDNPDHGSVSIIGCVGSEPCNGCIVRYTPAADYNGPDSFKYVVDDVTTCTSNEATVNVTVRAAPAAQNDQATTCAGDFINIDVLANDSDLDGTIHCGSIVITSGPSNGTATITAGCTGNEPCNTCFVRYTPTGSFTGVDQFSYTVEDSNGCVSNQAMVTVTVSPRPVTADDVGLVCQGDSITIDVLANDSGPIDPTSVEILTQPTNGIILNVNAATGAVTYRSDGVFCGGQDLFTYRVSSLNECGSQPATVRITVRCGPVANDDTILFDPGNIAAVDVDVLDNDFDPDGQIDCASLVILSGPNHGTAVISGGCVGFEPCDGCFVTYTPNATFDDFDTFTYQITDSDGCVDTARVNVQLEFTCLEETNRRRPGALLLYPEFDSREGILTMVTVTNTLTSYLAGTVDTEFVYRREGDCLEFNRSETLTPGDTISLIVGSHVPNAVRGFLYVVARCPETGEPIAYNGLIGQYIVFNGMKAFSYSVNAVAFEGIGSNPSPGCPQYARTDVDNDGIRDLNGIEYTRAPDQLVVPRFMGQSANVRSELVLLGLSGGAAFSTTVELLVFNDNEELFLRTHTFDCWTRVALEDISGVFLNEYLLSQTMHDIQEIVGAAGRKTGWILIDGLVAESSERTIVDPAVYAVLVECTVGGRCVADLPFELCEQSNGDLFPTTPAGDTTN